MRKGGREGLERRKSDMVENSGQDRWMEGSLREMDRHRKVG